MPSSHWSAMHQYSLTTKSTDLHWQQLLAQSCFFSFCTSSTTSVLLRPSSNRNWRPPRLNNTSAFLGSEGHMPCLTDWSVAVDTSQSKAWPKARDAGHVSEIITTWRKSATQSENIECLGAESNTCRAESKWQHLTPTLLRVLPAKVAMQDCCLLNPFSRDSLQASVPWKTSREVPTPKHTNYLSDGMRAWFGFGRSSVKNKKELKNIYFGWGKAYIGGPTKSVTTCSGHTAMSHPSSTKVAQFLFALLRAVMETSARSKNKAGVQTPNSALVYGPAWCPLARRLWEDPSMHFNAIQIYQTKGPICWPCGPSGHGWAPISGLDDAAKQGGDEVPKWQHHFKNDGFEFSVERPTIWTDMGDVGENYSHINCQRCRQSLDHQNASFQKKPHLQMQHQG